MKGNIDLAYKLLTNLMKRHENLSDEAIGELDIIISLMEGDANCSRAFGEWEDD